VGAFCEQSAVQWTDDRKMVEDAIAKMQFLRATKKQDLLPNLGIKDWPIPFSPPHKKNNPPLGCFSFEYKERAVKKLFWQLFLLDIIFIQIL
jgi:hypothetical protein